MRLIDADTLRERLQSLAYDDWNQGVTISFADACNEIIEVIEEQPTADVRDDATAHKVVRGGERDGSTCWFECDNCGLTVDISDVFCKHCGARFVP